MIIGRIEPSAADKPGLVIVIISERKRRGLRAAPELLGVAPPLAGVGHVSHGALLDT
jgi:hypothetical protein